jgi:hypothetical protein
VVDEEPLSSSTQEQQRDALRHLLTRSGAPGNPGLLRVWSCHVNDSPRGHAIMAAGLPPRRRATPFLRRRHQTAETDPDRRHHPTGVRDGSHGPTVTKRLKRSLASRLGRHQTVVTGRDRSGRRHQTGLTAQGPADWTSIRGIIGLGRDRPPPTPNGGNGLEGKRVPSPNDRTAPAAVTKRCGECAAMPKLATFVPVAVTAAIHPLRRCPTIEHVLLQPARSGPAGSAEVQAETLTQALVKKRLVPERPEQSARNPAIGTRFALSQPIGSEWSRRRCVIVLPAPRRGSPHVGSVPRSGCPTLFPLNANPGAISDAHRATVRA